MEQSHTEQLAVSSRKHGRPESPVAAKGRPSPQTASSAVVDPSTQTCRERRDAGPSARLSAVFMDQLSVECHKSL